MSKRRRSPGRVLLVALFALLMLFLLELQRFLPGSWPGGGGSGGSRALPTGSTPDPLRVVPTDGPTPPPVKPPETGVLHVTVRRADGTAVDSGSFRVGPPGTGERADVKKGEASVRMGKGVPTESAYVQPDGTEFAHGGGPPNSASSWVVVLPSHEPRWPRGVDRFLSPGHDLPALTVESSDGRPISGASVTVTGRDGERRMTTNASGVARIDAHGGVMRICASAPGFGESCRYLRARDVDSDPRLTLFPMTPRTTSFVDPASGAALKARSLKLVGRRGEVRTLERESGAYDRFEAKMPDDVAAESSLEIDVEGRPLVRVPIAGLSSTTAIPPGASREITLIDAHGAPVAGANVVASYAAEASSEHSSGRPIELMTKTDAQGRAKLMLPIDRDSEIVIDAATFAAEGLRVAAGAPSDVTPLEVKTTRGIDVRVIVRDDRGVPLAGADVIALSAAGRSTARRAATTDSAGEAMLLAIRPGRVEVLVHKGGFAWAASSQTVAAGGDAIPVRLKPGRRLALVVEDERGVPLPQVSVHSVPKVDAGRGTPDPTDPDAVPWETDAHGVLTVDDLADREIDVYLAKDGFEDEVLAKVRPGPSIWFATLVRKKAPSEGR